MVGKQVTNKPRRLSVSRAHKPKVEDNRRQAERFMDMARELGCDEDELAFRDKLRIIGQQKPTTAAPIQTKKSPRRGND